MAQLENGRLFHSFREFSGKPMEIGAIYFLFLHFFSVVVVEGVSQGAYGPHHLFNVCE